MKTTLIMIIDDHHLLRKSLIRLLNAELSDLYIIEAVSGEDALAILERGVHPDITLLDLSMPGMGGLAVCRLIVENYPGSKVVALTLNEEGSFIEYAMKCGACAYIDKNECTSKLITTIKDLLKGNDQ